MEIRLLEQNKDKTKASILIKGATPAVINTLRRAIVGLVPTMAIEDVEFKKNTSVVYDEIVAHRLGLLPLTTDLKSYELPSKCKCNGEGCARCTVQLTLKAKGSKTVYASELKSKDPSVVPVYEKMPIVKLIEGQEIEFMATAVLGQGKEHAKWCPGIAYYKHRPVIKINSSIKNPEAVVESCPKKIYEMKSGKIQVNKDLINSCDLCGACTDVASDKEIQIIENPDEYIFYIESFGQLKCKEMLQTALEILTQKFDEFDEELKKV